MLAAFCAVLHCSYAPGELRLLARASTSAMLPRGGPNPAHH